MNRRFTLIAILVFVLVLMVANPMQMSESGYSFDNQVDIEESFDDFDSLKTHTKSAGESWLVGWDYRQGQTLTYSAGAGTNYQFKYQVEYETGTSSGATVYLKNHAQTDFGDVRFTQSDGITLLDYWMEIKIDSDWAWFWVEFAEDLSTVSKTIYVYYGTSETTGTTSNGVNTFLFFDDFNDGSLHEKWTTYTGTPVESGGTLTCTGVNQEGVYSDDTWTYGRFRSRSYLTGPTSGTYGGRIGMIDSSAFTGSDFKTATYWVRTNTADTGARNGDADSIDTENIGDFDSRWYYYEILWQSASIKFLIDGNLKTTHTDTNDIYDSALPVGLTTHTYTGSSVSDWVFLAKYIVSEPAHGAWGSEQQAAPINDQEPVCTNLDDTNNLYARYKLYEFDVSVIDINGYEDIDYVELSSYDYDTSTLRWTVRFNQSSHEFTEESGSTYIDETGSTYNEDGVNLDLTIKLYIEWAHPDSTNDDLYQYVIDSTSASDADSYDSNYDYETRLDFSAYRLWDGDGTPDRGDYDEEDSVYADGTVIYYDSGDNYPPSSEVDVWISCADIAGSPWSDLTLYSGYFEISADSDDEIGNDTYTFIIVEEGDGSGGTDLCHTTHVDYYVADRVKWLTLGTDDSRISMTTDTTVLYATAELEFDNQALGSGDMLMVTCGAMSTNMAWDGSHFIIVVGYFESITEFTWVPKTSSYEMETEHGVSKSNANGHTVSVISDRVNLTLSGHWSIINCNTTLRATGVFEFDSTAWSGAVTWNEQFPVESTANTYNYGASNVASVTDPTYDITAFAVGVEASVVFDDASVSSIAYYWVQYSVDQVWLMWVSGTWTWAINGTTLNTGADGYCVIQSYINGTDDDWAIMDDTGQIGDLIVGTFTPSWYYVNLTMNCETTISGTSYDWQVWNVILKVDILHSLQITTFNIEPTADYFWITFQTNLMNASITVWDDAVDAGTLFADNIYNSDSEGMHQIPRSTIVALHNLTFCITSTGTNYDKDYTVHDYVWWYNITDVIIDPPAYDCHIVILDSLYNLIPFDTFEVYKNDTRIYHDIIRVVDGYAYNITVKNRFGDTVNSTIFSADFEMVIFVNTYSFKFMNWYAGFLRVNVTRAGVTYSEIIMPMEIIEFNLYEATYVFSVDFLNGTTKFEQEVTVSNSTGYVITGDSLTDVFNLVNSVYAMTTAINVTVTTTNNQVITISIDIDNMNSTIWDQTINILTNIENSNSTIYDQTITLIAQLSNVNSTLYAQTVTILSDLSNVNSTLFDQTVTLLSDIENVNSTLYSQTVTLLSNIANIDSDITAQTVTILSYIWNNANSIYNQTVTLISDISNTNSTIHSQIVSLLSQITNLESTVITQTVDILNYVWNNATSIYNQTISILSDISNVNTTLYSQTVTLLSNLANVNSTLYTQTVTMLSDLSNVNTTLYAQTVTLLSNIENVNSTLFDQTVSILSNMTNINSTIYSQTVEILSYIWNNANSIYNQTITLISDISNTNSTIHSQIVSLLSQITNMNSTIVSQTIDILNYVWNNATSIYNQTISILSDISNVNSTLYSQTVTLLSNLANVNSTLYGQTVTLIANIENIDSDIAAQTITILADISNVNSTLYDQTVTLLSEISNVNTTLYSQTVNILSSISNINSTLFDQTVSILTNITNVNATLYAQTVTLLADIANIDSDILAQTITLIAKIENVNSTIYSQTLDILTYISNVNVSLYSQTVTLITNVQNMNSTIYTQTLTILSSITNMNATIYTQTVTLMTMISNVNTALYSQSVNILTRLTNINATIYAQGVDVLTQIYNTNSTLYAQTVTMLLEIDDVEDLAESIKGLSETIKGEVADPPTPLSATDIFTMMMLVVLIFVFLIVVVWGIRALFRDRREGRVAVSAQKGEEIEVEDPIGYE